MLGTAIVFGCVFLLIILSPRQRQRSSTETCASACRHGSGSSAVTASLAVGRPETRSIKPGRVRHPAFSRPAWERGITSRPVIVMVDRQPVTSPADVLRMIEEAEKSNRAFVLLLVEGARGLHLIP